MARPRNKIPLTDELDFAYLLELMPPLHGEPEFTWLPELFSIVGHESLITLCKYAGGETIKIPTLNQLVESIEALQWFYDVCIKGSRRIEDVPAKNRELFQRILKRYSDAGVDSCDN